MDKRPSYEALEQRLKTLKRELAAANQDKADLQESRRWLKSPIDLIQTIIDTIEGEVFIKDAKGKYLYVNRAFGLDFEVDPQAVIGKDDYFVFPPEAAKMLRENDQQIMAGKKAVNIEEGGIWRGKAKTYLTNKVPLFNEDGSLFGICGVGVDITRQKTIEAALNDSNAQYQRLVEDLGNKFVIYSHGLDGTLTYAGPGMEPIFGITRKEMIGCDWTKKIAWGPGDLALAGENIRNMISGAPYRRMPMSFRHPNGKQRTIFVSPHPVEDSAGRIVGVEGIIEDITERKQTEVLLEKAHSDLERQVAARTVALSKSVAQLQEAEWRYRTVADFTYDWEYWVDLDGTLLYVSPACERISGYSPQQFIDKPALFSEIIFTEDQGAWESHYHDTRMDPAMCEIQLRIQHADGSLRWIEHCCRPVNGDHGELLGFRASNRDITGRKESELQLRNALSKIEILKAQLEADRIYLSEEIKLAHDYEHIIGDSDVLKYTLLRAEQVAATDTTVLILGETGTGKELIARAIHGASERKERPLIKVNCAALPANLIESELFGHERGAFSGAVEKRVGRFELASGATLFLDEIGELPLELQSKLLRVLQDGEFERLGSSQTLRADVRVIAATNRNLEEDVRNKVFRLDLWYRLSVFMISVPPLRERSEDIDQLVNYMINNFAKKLGKQIKSIPTDILLKLQKYPWPGNVRELENVIERGVINSPGDELRLEDALDFNRSEEVIDFNLPMKSLAEIEREHILRALQQTNWQIQGDDGAAALLDINPSTLRGRMRKLRISRKATHLQPAK